MAALSGWVVALHIHLATMAPKKSTAAKLKISEFQPTDEECQAAEAIVAGLSTDQRKLKNRAMMQYAKANEDKAAIEAKDTDKRGYIVKYLALQTAKSKGRISSSGKQYENKKKVEKEQPMTRFMIEKDFGPDVAELWIGSKKLPTRPDPVTQS